MMFSMSLTSEDIEKGASATINIDADFTPGNSVHYDVYPSFRETFAPHDLF